MNYLRKTLILLTALHWSFATAQPGGEAGEPSPEELDAAFSSEDAAREAAAFTDAIILQGTIDPLGEMTAAADLVFRGSVHSKSFVYDADGIPYTHTTFLIADLLKGSWPDGELTLVQPGGPAQDGSKKMLLVSSAEHFNVGEEELLFIELESGSQEAPRHMEVQQRFRIYEGKVYSEEGRGVAIKAAANGSGRRLVLSRDRHPSEHFRQIHIGPHTLKRNYGSIRGQPGAVLFSESARARSASREQSYTDSVDIETFSAAIAK